MQSLAESWVVARGWGSCPVSVVSQGGFVRAAPGAQGGAAREATCRGWARILPQVHPVLLWDLPICRERVCFLWGAGRRGWVGLAADWPVLRAPPPSPPHGSETDCSPFTGVTAPALWRPPSLCTGLGEAPLFCL